MSTIAANTECLRIADQIRRAFDGNAFHGDPLSKILQGVKAEQAAGHPVAGAHSIWELLLHVEGWTRVVGEAIGGKPMPGWPVADAGSDFLDWPPVPQATPDAWQAAVAKLLATGRELSDRVAKFSEARLNELVPGRKYDFYFLFHGIVQHSLYHAGQIAVIKKAGSSAS